LTGNIGSGKIYYRGQQVNINYHYYTIKTLARYAGFDDSKAQYIAYFSQYIDDYKLGSPFIVGTKPPDFFLKNNLALKLGSDKWVFLPCPTGINVMGSIDPSYQLHTLMPFHFIMSRQYNEMFNISSRRDLCCVVANQEDSLLINSLMEQTVQGTDVNDKNSLMALGMLIHTYADTYAHCGFSGFNGWENKYFISKMKHNIPQKENGNVIVKSLRNIKEKVTGIKDPYDAMSPAAISLASNLPPIGHGRVVSAPDYCDCTISLHAMKTEKGKMEPLIERNNGEFFADCSRRILNFLCSVNKKTLLTDEEWKDLQKKLLEAQNVREQGSSKKNKNKWSEVFPGITYKYNKKENVSIDLEILKFENEVLKQADADKNDLLDIYSENGNKAREASFMYAKNVSNEFYKYNELAYCHVNKATGKYVSDGAPHRLKNYHALASEFIN
jgi:hypothetical protein